MSIPLGRVGTVKPPMGSLLNRAHPLSRGLVAYWSLCEGVGSTAYDISGNGNHGALTNLVPGTAWVPTPHGYGVDCTADGQCIVSSSEQLNLPGKVTAWALVHVDTIARWDNILHKNNTYRIWANVNGKLAATIRTSSETAIDSTIAFPTGRIASICLTWGGDGTDAVLYLDGKQVATATPSGVMSTTLPFAFGGTTEYASRCMDGRSIACAVWARQLSAGEVGQLYADPFGLLARPLRLWPTTAGGAYSVTIADALGMADDLTPVYAAIASLSDTLSVADAASVLSAYTTGIADGLGIAGAVGGVYSASVSIADAVGLAETITVLWAAIVTIADTVQIADAVTQAAAAYVVALADGMGIADAIVAAGAYAVTIADGITLADAIVAALPVSLSRQVLNILRTRHSISLTHVRHAIDILTD
jgi:hypothetical protein